MGKDKMFEARMQGMNYALKVVKASGVEALETEIRMRGLYDVPIGITKKDLEVAITQVKQDIACELQRRILLIAKQVLHDKFGFGHVRMDRFLAEVENLCQCLIEKNVSYEDLETMQREEKV